MEDRSDQLCDKADCPGMAMLRAYMVGDLPEPDIERVSHCATECLKCQETVCELDSCTDPMIRRLRVAVQGEQSDDESLRQPLGQAEMVAAEALVRADLPDQLGQYRILGKIGSGGMGTVYRAEHVKLRKVVALKLISSLRSDDANSVTRFHREMHAVGQVDHENIVRATDAGEDQGQHFLAMEYIDGVDLAFLLKRDGQLPIAESCEVIRQAALGLEHAHRKGIIHRDIKPSNLMISTSGKVKVLDLGLARMVGGDDGQTAASQQHVLGTLDFIAPEQAAPGEPVDARSDVYGLGCTLYTLLAGRPPFHDVPADEPLKKLAAHAQLSATPIDVFRPEVASGIVAILERMLAKLPQERFQSADSVADALEPYALGADVKMLLTPRSNVQTERPNPLVLDTPRSPINPSKGSLGSTRGLRKPWILWSVIIAALFAACATGPLVNLWQTHEWVTIVLSDDILTGNVTLWIDEHRIDHTEEPRWLKHGEHSLELRRGAEVLRSLIFQVGEGHENLVTIDRPFVAPSDTRTTVGRLLELGARLKYKRGTEELWAGTSVDQLGSWEPGPATALWTVDLKNHSLDHDVLRVVAGLDRVGRLILDNTPIKDSDLAVLREIRGVQEIELRHNKTLTNACIGHIQSCTKLSTIFLDDVPITDEGVEQLASIATLQWVSLHGTQVTNEGVKHLGALPLLEWLSLSETQVTGECLKFLPAEQLQVLYMEWIPLRDDGLKPLKRFESLQLLYLSGNEITDSGVQELRDLPELLEVGLANNPMVSGEGLEELLTKGRPRKLKTIFIDETKVTQAEKGRLEKAFPGINFW